MTAITITARNCMTVTGMSWVKAQQLASQHGVPILQISPRCRVIEASAFVAAVERASRAAPRDRLDEMLVAAGVKKR